MPARSSGAPCSCLHFEERTMTGETARPPAAGERDVKADDLVAERVRATFPAGVHYEKRPVKDSAGQPVAGLSSAWIILDNPTQLNSYTTEMVKAVILAFRAASAARDVVAVVFTGSGDKARWTGGNPQEYRAYMRLFNDMVTGPLTPVAPLTPVFVGGTTVRSAKLQMACDFSI